MDQIKLVRPFVSVKRDKQGEFNFTDLLDDEQPEAEQKTTEDDPFPITISQIGIVKGKVSWEDRFYSQTQKEDIYPLTVNIDNFTTKRDKYSQLGFSLTFASGGQIDWSGQLKLKPLESSGHVKLEKIDFHRVWELFLQDTVKFDVRKGSQIIEADYHFADMAEGIQLIINKAYIDVSSFQFTEKGAEEPLVSIPVFKVSGVSVNLLEKNIEIAEVLANDARFKAWLNNDGRINYQSLFAADEEEKMAPQHEQKTDNKNDAQWHVAVKKLALNNFTLNFVDKTLPVPAVFNVTSLSLNATDITNKPGAEVPFNLGLMLNDEGFLKIKGHTVLDPLTSNLQLDAGKIAIKDFQPYFDKFARLDVISGLFNVNAKISLLQEENKPFGISLQGNSHINNLVTRDQISNKDFLNWKQLSLNNIAIDLAAKRYTIDTIKIEEPYTRILIRKDKTMNVNDLLIKADEESSSDDKQQPVDKPAVKQQTVDKNEQISPYFKIGKIEMTGGETDFSDLSLILPFIVHMDQLKGTVKNVSSEKSTVTNMVLAGRAGGLSPVNIIAKINPDKGDSELSLDFTSMSLPLASPYMAEFAGRKIEKGNMSLKLKYKIINNQLTASNSLLIDQLVLGEEVENENAVSLPLDLAIALLKDSDGKIVLDVPITGNLESPEFSVSAIVADALFNVITKVISSPFNAIVSLTGSDEDMSKVLFAAGKTVLSDTQKKKLDELNEALSKRPGLKLEIKGTAFSQYDWPYLQAEALDKQLLQIRVDELNQDNKKKVSAKDIKLTKDEYDRLLADVFIQKFPKLAERSAFGTPRLIDPEMGDFYQIAKTRMAAVIPPEPLQLRKLAKARAKVIARYLVEKGFAIERIFILNVGVDPKDSDGSIATILNLTAG
jgi:hypothetical protein